MYISLFFCERYCSLFRGMMLICIIYLTTSCRKKVIEKEEVYIHDTVQYSWKPYKKISYSPVMYKISYTKLKYYSRPLVLFYNPLTAYVYDSLDKQFNLIFPSSFSSSSVIPPDFSPFIGTSLSENAISLSVFMPYLTSHNSSCWRNPVIINLKGIDTSVTSLNRARYKLSEYGNKWVGAAQRNGKSDILITLKFKDSACLLKVVDTTKIELPNASFLSVAGSFKDRFLINYPYNGTILLREDNTFSLVLPNSSISSNFFLNYKDTLFVYDEYHYVIYYSTDIGESWNIYRSNVYIPFVAKFVILNNSVISFLNDKIYLINLKYNNFFQRELKNDGLENSIIMDAFYSNDTVIITTTRGMYYKSYKEFIQPK
ncbi:MAG: hypothetical protein KatS3mg027_2450 [Bacteroidia bacterium]|nr:MAG: hypothetical protein KatS3mg027_2450 [Bacteroidia bacterium]